jgi:hypothetical protein
MPVSQPPKGFRVSSTSFWVKPTVALILCASVSMCTRAQNPPPNNTKSWTVTTESSRDNTDPSRTTESHVTIGNRRIDTQSMQLRAPDGDYQPYYDTETETTAVDAATTRTVVRTYTWDGNKQRVLVAVSEEESITKAGGDAEVVRTVSSADTNGNLQVVRREVADTKHTSPNAQEVQTTTYLADGNGGFTPSLQTRELQTRNTDHTVEVNKKTLWPDADGAWTVHEVSDGTITEDGANRTTDERLSRADLNGNLSQVSRTVSKQTRGANGDQTNTVDTYSVDIPGQTRDTALHLSRRVTTTQKSDATGETTEQLVEEPDPADSNGGLQVTKQTVDLAQSTSSGAQHTKTYKILDANGNLTEIAVQTSNSNQPLTRVRVSPQ